MDLIENNDKNNIHNQLNIRENHGPVYLGGQDPNLAPAWTVPYPKNEFLTGRDELIIQLHDAFQTNNRQGIYGLGGIGKTQIASEYAHKYRAEYPGGVFWVIAESVSSIHADFIRIAELLNLGEHGSKDAVYIRDVVLAHFNGRSDYLLILDNIPENVKALGEVSQYLPTGSSAHLLATSRTKHLDQVGIFSPIEIRELSNDESVEFLSKRTSRCSESAEAISGTRILAGMLFGLPLALEQAAMYIKHKASVVDYIQFFESKRLTVFKDILPGTGSYNDTVATTWLINFIAVAEESPNAEKLLKICAFLAPDKIQEQLFLDGAVWLPAEISELLLNHGQQELSNLLFIIEKYSLVRRFQDKTFQIHRLVQESIRDSTGKPECVEWVAGLARLLSKVFRPDAENYRICEEYLPHVEECCKGILIFSVEFDVSVDLIVNCSFYLDKQRRFNEAFPYHIHALSIRLKLLGPNHPDIARSLNNLGYLYIETGQMLLAEDSWQRALIIRENAFGPTSREVSESKHNLGTLYAKLGRFDEAMRYLKDAYDICLKIHGVNHYETAQTLAEIAKIRPTIGQSGTAEEELLVALRTLETSRGPDHPDTASVLNALGEYYLGKGEHSRAVRRFERAHSIRTYVLGSNHSDTISSQNKLAIAYCLVSNRKRALSIASDSLALCEQPSFMDKQVHAETLHLMFVLKSSVGELDEAFNFLSKSEILLVEQGRNGLKETAEAFGKLADQYIGVGNYDKACNAYKRAVGLSEQIFGAQHHAVNQLRSRLLEVQKIATNKISSLGQNINGGLHEQNHYVVNQMSKLGPKLNRQQRRAMKKKGKS